MEVVEFSHINLLLQAPSKDFVLKLCQDSFTYRHSKKKPEELLNATSDQMNISKGQSQELLAALGKLMKNAVFVGSVEPSDIIALFPNDFQKNLRDLLGKILIENIPQWRDSANNDLVSLPRLVDFDWRVDVKSSSDSMPRMSVPTCILQLQVEEPKNVSNEGVSTSHLNVELSKETLDTMLDGLGKIRQQLSSVTNQ